MEDYSIEYNQPASTHIVVPRPKTQPQLKNMGQTAFQASPKYKKRMNNITNPVIPQATDGGWIHPNIVPVLFTP